MKKRLPALLLLMMMVFYCQAKQKGDYYIVDSTAVYGVVLLDYGIIENCQYCSELVEKEFRHLTPDQLSEYGFASGSVYVAKKIKVGFLTKNVFLEKRVVGDFCVYQYKDRKNDLLFLQYKDGVLNPLPEQGEGLKASLDSLVSNVVPVTSAPRLVEYNPNSIVRYIGQCIGMPSKLRTKLGFGLGLGLTSMSLPSPPFVLTLPLENGRNQTSQWAKVFLERELSRKGLSTRLEVGYSNMPVAYHQINGSSDVRFEANKKALDASLMFKYSMDKGLVRPYFLAGASGVWNFQRENFVFKSLIHSNIVELIEMSPANRVDQFQFGPNVGLGLAVPFQSNMSFFLETRFVRSYGVSLPDASEFSTFMFSTGLTF